MTSKQQHQILSRESTLHQRQPSPLPRNLEISLDSPPTPIHHPPNYDPSGPTTPHGHPPHRLLVSTSVTPLPFLRILPLLIARCSEGLVYAVIFPYINTMVAGFGVPEHSVGVWSAAAESALMVTEAVAAPLYAMLADRIGRRPIEITLLILWSCFAMGFGLVENVWSAVLIRGCLGLCAGLGVLSRTMVGEICDKTNRIQGFALFTPSLTVGVTLGPLIGGFLANPVPRLLSSSFTTFVQYPYLLPAIVTGSTGVMAAVAAIFLLSETLPASLRRARAQKDRSKGSRGGAGELLRYPPFRNVLILYSINDGIQFAWEAIYPLFAFTSPSLGGLGLSTQEIGIVLAFSAVLSIFQTAFLFPVLHRAIPDNIYLPLCLASYPFAVLFFPIIWSITYANNGRMGVAAWMALAIQIVFRRIGDFAATMLDTIVLDSIPGPEHLALANSSAFSVGAIGRAAGPFIVSWFFSLSSTFPSATSFGRQLVWIVFALMSMPSIYLAYRMQSQLGRPGKEGSEEERYELMGQKHMSDDGIGMDPSCLGETDIR